MKRDEKTLHGKRKLRNDERHKKKSANENRKVIKNLSPQVRSC
jgi:hypothetical protein